MELMRTLSHLGLQVDVVPRFYDVVSSGMDAYSVEGVPLLGIRPVRLAAPARVAKRAIDVAGSALVLLLVAPLMLAIAILIKLDSPGPVFFRQRRIGAGNRSFRIWKFRTMLVDADERKAMLAHLNQHARNGDGRLFKIVDDPRVTRAGRFLRRHYLDEFPQLINVFRGEMSLVGPRPLIPEEAQHVDEWALERLNLKPGMTGLWQVLGGSAISFGEMVKLDYLYVTTWSLWNDIRLLAQTVPVVFRGSRAHH
jgi:exopolysaccharide biosynthesis polyprenyl glycosylphosphotransferase